MYLYLFFYIKREYESTKHFCTAALHPELQPSAPLFPACHYWTIQVWINQFVQ